MARPHTTNIELKHILKTVLGANVGQISFEAANARHEHEWAVWDEQRDLIPDDLILVPGVVSHATNLVERPDLVAQRIERFAKIVGPERVIGSRGLAAPHSAAQSRRQPRAHSHRM